MVSTLVLVAAIGCSDATTSDGGPACDVPADNYYVVFGTGAGFDAYEGEVLTAVTSTATRDVLCTSSAPARISGGTFTVEITNPWDGFSAYPRFGAFLDSNGNDHCDEGEPVWTSVRILIDRTVTGQLRGDDDGRCSDL